MTIEAPGLSGWASRAGTCMAVVMLACGCTPAADTSSAALDARLQALEAGLADARAQNAIRGLMHAYGRLIDARDWEGFARLWTDQATYVGGPGGNELEGGPAIAGFLRGIIASNPSGVGEPNFHVFFNEEIQVSGTRARATSMSAFVTPDPSGAPVMVILARYEDEFVQQDGEWRFQRRVVRGNLPAPRSAAR